MSRLVFIVEDDDIQQKIFQEHFKQIQEDYVIRIFDDPEQLCKHLDEKPYVVVLDHHFTGSSKTGLDYLKIIRKKHPSIPVIYYTASDDDTLREQVMKLGAQEYIVKDSASLLRLRTAFDILKEKGSKRGFLKNLFKR